MRIIICDDDKRVCDTLLDYCSESISKRNLSDIECACFNSGEELLQDKGKKDIVFLDIEMRGISGITVGSKIKKENANAIIIIVTAYSEYLDDAMRFHVFRYIEKPINKTRFQRNFNDAIKEYDNFNKKLCIALKNDNNITIKEADIVFIESVGRNSIIHCISGKYECISGISYWMGKLNNHIFYQTHRCFIVNMKYVKQFDKNGICMEHVEEHPLIAKRKYTQFKDDYILFLEDDIG